MKKVLFIIKVIWQILLYSVEVVVISFLLTLIVNKFNKYCSYWDFIERFLACYAIYQIIVLLILNNINDIKKDSCLAYITILKKLILYCATKDKLIKKEILANINYQLDEATINDNIYRKKYKFLKEKMDNNNINKRDIELELINAESNYEHISLNWRYSFLLRLFK